jgi:hypothetical protein
MMGFFFKQTKLLQSQGGHDKWITLQATCLILGLYKQGMTGNQHVKYIPNLDPSRKKINVIARLEAFVNNPI